MERQLNTLIENMSHDMCLKLRPYRPLLFVVYTKNIQKGLTTNYFRKINLIKASPISFPPSSAGFFLPHQAACVSVSVIHQMALILETRLITTRLQFKRQQRSWYLISNHV